MTSSRTDPASLDGSGALAGPWVFTPEVCREYARRLGGFIVAQAWQEGDGWRWRTFRRDGRLPPSRGPLPSLRAAQAAADARLQARGLRLSTAPALMAVKAIEPEPASAAPLRMAAARIGGTLAHTVGRRCLDAGLDTDAGREEVRRLCVAVGAPPDVLAELNGLPPLEACGAADGGGRPSSDLRALVRGGLVAAVLRCDLDTPAGRAAFGAAADALGASLPAEWRQGTVSARRPIKARGTVLQFTPGGRA